MSKQFDKESANCPVNEHIDLPHDLGTVMPTIILLHSLT